GLSAVGRDGLSNKRTQIALLELHLVPRKGLNHGIRPRLVADRYLIVSAKIDRRRLRPAALEVSRCERDLCEFRWRHAWRWRWRWCRSTGWRRRRRRAWRVGGGSARSPGSRRPWCTGRVSGAPLRRGCGARSVGLLREVTPDRPAGCQHQI